MISMQHHHHEGHLFLCSYAKRLSGGCPEPRFLKVTADARQGQGQGRLDGQVMFVHGKIRSDKYLVQFCLQLNIEHMGCQATWILIIQRDWEGAELVPFLYKSKMIECTN